MPVRCHGGFQNGRICIRFFRGFNGILERWPVVDLEGDQLLVAMGYIITVTWVPVRRVQLYFSGVIMS